MPRSATLRLEIIAEELFINSAIHGGQGVGAEISLLVRDAGVDIELVVEDGAAAFNPFDGPEPPSASTNPDERPVGRLGRALVVGLCSRSRYERLDGRNRVTVGVFKAVGAARSRG